MRILIAEDQPELRRMLVKNLTAVGYTVDGVPDGAEALAYLDAAAYDAAVLDIMMPKVDGLTVLRTLDGKVPASRLSGYGEENRITNVTLRNVTILGEKMTNLKQMKLRYDDYCEGIVVE